MLWKKTGLFWKSGLIAINIMLFLGVSGCSDTQQNEKQVIENESKVQDDKDNDKEDASEIIGICLDLYIKASEENKLTDLEVIRNIIKQLGEKGYPAIDSRNQIDMTEPEQVTKFCQMVDTKEQGELTMIEVTYGGGFVKYDLCTNDGKVDVVQSYYKYENGNIRRVTTGSYLAENWNYSKDGYLFFSGVWLSEEQYVLTLSETEEHIGFRVKPLDENCRELNRKYLLPIGYGQNNMFIVDWSEDDFGNLNFYDLYDIFYSQLNSSNVPYSIDDNLGAGSIYRIPKDKFENVIMTYFDIDSEALQSKTTYYDSDETYEYRPRGFYEVEYPEYPYSEVIEFSENSDGTITLLVNVVFPYAGISKVYAHEVVVRPFLDGKIQYVSNRIIPSEYNYKEEWHTPRLTEEKWIELYGGKK